MTRRVSKIVTMQNVASPCVSVCALDENDICVGCYRSAEEITRWMAYSDEEKRQVLVNCADRAKILHPHQLL